jgi:hypothetical protein
VRLVIHREDDEIYETLDVELVKKRERGLGLRYELHIYQYCIKGCYDRWAVGKLGPQIANP